MSKEVFFYHCPKNSGMTSTISDILNMLENCREDEENEDVEENSESDVERSDSDCSGSEAEETQVSDQDESQDEAPKPRRIRGSVHCYERNPLLPHRLLPEDKLETYYDEQRFKLICEQNQLQENYQKENEFIDIKKRTLESINQLRHKCQKCNAIQSELFDDFRDLVIEMKYEAIPTPPARVVCKF